MELDAHYIHPELREHAALMALYKRYTSKAKAIHYGRNRIVFDMGNYVVKLPCAYGGFGDNDWEGSVSNGPVQLANPMDYIQYARTRLMYVGDIPVCLMEKVRDPEVHPFKDPKMPSWVGSVDCGQVGHTRRGRLVAYDWGYN